MAKATDNILLSFATVTKGHFGWLAEFVFDGIDDDDGKSTIFMIVSDDIDEIGKIMTEAAKIDDENEVKAFFNKFNEDGEEDEVSLDGNDGQEGEK